MEEGKRPIRVLLLTDGIYPFVVGGIAKHSYYLAKYLGENGVKVELWHTEVEGGAPDHLKEMPDFPHSNVSIRFLTWPKKGVFPGHYIRDYKEFSVQLARIIKEDGPPLERFDLIYAQGFTAFGFINQRKDFPPIITNLHGYEMFQRAPSFSMWLRLLLLRRPAKMVSLKSDYVFSFGGKLTDILLGLGVPKAQILECSIGVERNWLVDHIPERKGKDVVRFVFVGRYERRKGIEELRSALMRIIEEGIGDFYFEFVGPVPESLQIDHPSIYYHGEIRKQERVREIVRSSDVLVCPSHSEGMPTVIMEGLASGLAILGTDVGAISQQIVGNGWLLEKIDTGLLTQTLKEIIKIDRTELQDKKEKSLALMKENFLWDAVIIEKISYFKSILSKKRATNTI